MRFLDAHFFSSMLCFRGYRPLGTPEAYAGPARKLQARRKSIHHSQIVYQVCCYERIHRGNARVLILKFR
jgi:hypothetical protein